MEEIFYKGALIDKEHKRKRGLFFLEELFVGDFNKKAPKRLREKINPDIINSLEIRLACFYRIPIHAKSTFDDYRHLVIVLESMGIKLKRFLE